LNLRINSLAINILNGLMMNSLNFSLSNVFIVVLILLIRRDIKLNKAR